MRSHLNRHERSVTPPVPYDHWLIFTVICLMSIGLLMVASASIVISDTQLHQPFYYLYRQLAGLILGLLMGGIVIQFEIATWQKVTGIMLFGAIFLLILVLIPGVGHVVKGSARWLGVGVFRIQASEFAKFAVVLYIAHYSVRKNAEIKTYLKGFMRPFGILVLVSLLLLREPDFGATVVIMTTALGMMFLAGMRLQHFLFLFILILAAFIILAMTEPYRLERLTTFMNPWENAYHSGYQLTQSLIAFGRGGWFGVGLGKSIQKLFYLPEAHTDFVFAVIAEEFGLMGALIIIFLFTFLVLRIFWIGREALRLGKPFAGFIAYGFALWIAIQFTVSIGVNTGVLPTKGLTLPLVSYGGNSMLMSCVVIAMLLRIDYENRTSKLGLGNA